MKNDLALDPVTGDLFFDENGSMKLVNGIYFVRQKIGIRLKWFLGEWYLNKNLGVPYYEKILIKNPNKLDIINYIKRQVLLTEGVQSIEKFDLKFIEKRTLEVTFTAKTSYGKIQYNEIYTVN